MLTPIYLKMDAHDSLLLSEGVCRQLGIVTYHPSISVHPAGKKTTPVVEKEKTTPLAEKEKTTTPARVVEGTTTLVVETNSPPASRPSEETPLTIASEISPSRAPKVGSVRVKLVKTIRILPQQSQLVEVEVEDKQVPDLLLLMEPTQEFTDEEDGVYFGESLVKLSPEGRARVSLSNLTGMTRKLEKGSYIGDAVEATVVAEPDSTADRATPTDSCDTPEIATVQSVSSANPLPTLDVSERKKKLASMIAEIGPELTWQERDALRQLVLEKHLAFAVEDEEDGCTDLVEMTIETGDATPVRAPLRRTPFAAREEIAEQLVKMQARGIIQPSTSPWASPVILVRKKDGTLRFCIDYRALNAVTKTDQFPLPRIDDLLDQLGKTNFFSTLDLSAGYWQVKMHPDSKEKTAFATYQGLYEFNVMPFGLKNAPAVFQRLMQRVLMDLNPLYGPSFVSTYIDDTVVYSSAFEAHLAHLRRVLDRLIQVGLKLKPQKCHFLCPEVDFLGYLITPQGIHPNPQKVAAVREYPVPKSVKEVRQFVGFASYYRRFVRGFSRVAQPLHALTRKGVVFAWTQQCQEAFDALRSLLVEAPILIHPDFDKPFVLETNASAQGLGAVLSQVQDDKRLHPIAYASRALSPQEKKYAITELETLAVVWAVQHYHAYLYGHEVTVYTDHSAVKAVLETPSPSGKHARWWSKVFGSGVQKLEIIYRAGKENANADALSRAPWGESPSEALVTEVQVASIHSASDLLSFGASNCAGQAQRVICGTTA